MTIVDELFYYFSRLGRVGYTVRRLWSVLPTRWMPIPLSAATGKHNVEGSYILKLLRVLVA